MNIDDIHSLVSEDMQQIDLIIFESFKSDVALVNQLAHYILNSGGKRIRPIIIVFAAKALGYLGTDHRSLAAIIEFIHTATLLHDDVIDASELRRGKQTANAVWGNDVSVLVGDFLYSRAFEMMVSLQNMRVMEIFARTTNTIAEGEVMQLMNSHDPTTTELQYHEVIYKKTAKLFEASAQLGAIIANADQIYEDTMKQYGLCLGVAFQLIDDVLDYNAKSEDIGKNIGDDLAEGKPTLPLIRAIQQGTTAQVALISEAIKQGGRDNVESVIKVIESTDAIEYTKKAAQDYANKAIAALEPLPNSAHKEALCSLASFAVSRAY